MDRGWLVLTGATGPFGRAVAAGWRARGGAVLPISRQTPPAGGGAWVRADLRDPEAAGVQLEEWMRREGIRPVAFVHGAGLVYAAPAHTTTPDEWRQMFAVNLEAGFLLARVTAAAMPPAGGALVLVSSIDSQRVPSAGPAAAYGAAKAGLEALARHLAVEWGDRGIRVNAVCLGPLSEGIPMAPAVRSQLTGLAADRRLTTPAEAAQVVLWLLSSDASAITGQCLTVDHGLTLRY
jgi:NAD(P)-dependent dehydrogenase (short-subunit alcohol dehydrogenase family)